MVGKPDGKTAIGENAVKTSPNSLAAEGLLQILQGTPVATFVLDSDHRVTHWNHACELVTGVAAGEVLGTRRAWAAFYDAERPVLADLVIDGLGEADVARFYGGKYHPSPVVPDAWEAEDFFSAFADGGRWLAFTAAPLRDHAGNVIGAIETLRDITTQKRAEAERAASEMRLAQIVDGSSVPMFVLDADHRVTHWNKACEAIIGASASEMVGTTDQWRPFYPERRPVLADVVLDGGTERTVEAFYSGKYTASPLVPGGWEAVDYFPHFANGPRWLYFTAVALRDSQGVVVGAVETLQDISAQKHYENELLHQANHDALTGLANRTLLSDRLDQALARCHRSQTMLALCFIDLDKFKVVNDSLGHNTGDALVRTVARRLEDCIREGDTVARMGGDEFVVLLEPVDQENAVTEIMRRIQASLAAPVMIDGQEVFTGASIGVALYPRDGSQAEDLMVSADTAMYRAKQGGGGMFEFYAPVMNQRMADRLNLERDLRHAVDQGEFVLHYQPQIDAQTGYMLGVEALVRWRHPEKGLIAPGDFIPLAEETGLIVPLGRWVLEEACRQGAAWRQAGLHKLRMGINLSARQFSRNAIARDILGAIENQGLGCVCLELELTESMVMHDPVEAAYLLAQLKEAGLRLSMDDFGTGYSSLSHLRDFPFDILKIDQSFVRDIGASKNGGAIARAVISLAQSLDLEVIAEGVERQDQLDFLQAHGCHEIQGFLFSPPVDASTIAGFLKSGEPLPTRPLR